MKIQITLKDPDVLQEAIEESLESLEIAGLDEAELNAVKERRLERVTELASHWFKYGEYVTLELDTELKTLIVLENEE